MRWIWGSRRHFVVLRGCAPFGDVNDDRLMDLIIYSSCRPTWIYARLCCMPNGGAEHKHKNVESNEIALLRCRCLGEHSKHGELRSLWENTNELIYDYTTCNLRTHWPGWSCTRIPLRPSGCAAQHHLQPSFHPSVHPSAISGCRLGRLISVFCRCDKFISILSLGPPRSVSSTPHTQLTEQRESRCSIESPKPDKARR